MGTRAQLHNILLAICDNVYYQTPEGYKMNYPCIRYDRTERATAHANNNPYAITKGYTVMTITSDADDTISDQVALLSSCEFKTGYKRNNLYHDVFNIYY